MFSDFSWCEPSRDKTNKLTVCRAKTQISLGIRPVWSVFAVHLKKHWVLSYPLSAQQRLWSDWVDAQADLSLRWAHSHFVGFVVRRLMYSFNTWRKHFAVQKESSSINNTATWLYLMIQLTTVEKKGICRILPLLCSSWEAEKSVTQVTRFMQPRGSCGLPCHCCIKARLTISQKHVNG